MMKPASNLKLGKAQKLQIGVSPDNFASTGRN